MEPDPADTEHEEYGMPVTLYRFATLTEGKARLQLLDEKTVWEFDAHAPQWKSTGVCFDETDPAKLGYDGSEF